MWYRPENCGWEMEWATRASVQVVKNSFKRPKYPVCFKKITLCNHLMQIDAKKKSRKMNKKRRRQFFTILK